MRGSPALSETQEGCPRKPLITPVSSRGTLTSLRPNRIILSSAASHGSLPETAALVDTLASVLIRRGRRTSRRRSTRPAQQLRHGGPAPGVAGVLAGAAGELACDAVSAAEPDERYGDQRGGDRREANHVLGVRGLDERRGHPEERRDAVRSVRQVEEATEHSSSTTWPDAYCVCRYARDCRSQSVCTDMPR
jgi:hypothetical protein